MSKLFTVLSLLALLATPAWAEKNARYECGTHSDGVLVILPVAPLNADVAEVTIVFHGENMKATYVRQGLKQFWYLTGEIYIELSPTMSAMYWDFTDAEEGETRSPEAVFTTCTKRG
ncbi:MAG: hypothetical protein O3A13_15625 [Proteobacteria bacterium]|nr:hypothetical protein [Pseudomonadota bacterium]